MDFSVTIITGGIDLSVGSVAALCGALAAGFAAGFAADFAIGGAGGGAYDVVRTGMTTWT